MLNKLKKVTKKEDEALKHDFILNMTDFLMSYGFKPEEAMKLSKEFYNKHKNKIRDVLAI